MIFERFEKIFDEKTTPFLSLLCVCIYWHVACKRFTQCITKTAGNGSFHFRIFQENCRKWKFALTHFIAKLWKTKIFVVMFYCKTAENVYFSSLLWFSKVNLIFLGSCYTLNFHFTSHILCLYIYIECLIICNLYRAI